MDYITRFLLKLSPANIEKGIQISTTFLVGLIIILISQKALKIFFNGLKNKSHLSSYSNRLDTARGLLDNFVMVAILGITLLLCLRSLGFDITPILTGAGILGLAISFGAQTIVKDVLSGFFIIIENQYNVGNQVKINDISGEVFKINLRTTVLKDKKENMIYIPNSEIKTVLVYNKS